MPAWIDDFLAFRTDPVQWAAAHPELATRSAVEETHRAVLSAIHTDRATALRLASVAWELASASKDKSALALAARILGNARYANDEYSRAVEHYSQALDIFEQLRDEKETGRTLMSAMQSLGYLGQYDRALGFASRARAIFESEGDQLRVARIDSNTANLFYRQDRHEEAIELYQRALSSFRRVGEPADVAAALSNIAVCSTSLGKFTAAREAYEEARVHCERHGLTHLVAQADYNIAWLYYLRGDYVRAMDLYALTRRHCEQISDSYHLALCDLDEAEMFLELNLVSEGADLARRAAARFESLGMEYEQGRALVSQALAATHQRGRTSPVRLFGKARTLFLAQGNHVWPAVIDLYGAMLARRRGKSARALQLCRAAGRTLSGSLLPGRAALCELLESQLLLDRGDVIRARELALVALGRLELSETRAQRVTAYSLLARIEEIAGRENSAFEYWLRARKEIEALRRRLWGESPRIAFLKDKLAVYESLVRLYLRRGDTASALAAIEQAKSRSMAEVLTAPELLPLDSESADALRDLHAGYRQLELASLSSHAPSERRAREMRDRIRLTEGEIARRVTGARSAAPASDVLVDETALRRAIPAGTLLLDYFEIRGVLHACLIHQGPTEILPVAESAEIRSALRYFQLQVSRMRSGKVTPAVLQASARIAQTHLRELYEGLVAPFGDRLLNFSHLVVMPCGILHEVPFHALHDGVRFLIDTHSVSYAPSAQVYDLCLSRSRSRKSSALVLGIPDAAAPSIAAESAAVAQILGADYFEGIAATSEILRTRGAESRVIHIATHGIFRRDNPLFSSIRLGDARFSVLDLYQLSLDADLVTLSGCGTGLNAVIGGDELMGLVRGVLYAGARTVLASLWDVHDESTTEFMRRFYSVAAGGRPQPEALREAMREMRGRWFHPCHWAPFLLVGAAQ
jgi:CHAT domain-containing protein/tetratricopeptide (TPR) repeat protein